MCKTPGGRKKQLRIGWGFFVALFSGNSYGQAFIIFTFNGDY